MHALNFYGGFKNDDRFAGNFYTCRFFIWRSVSTSTRQQLLGKAHLQDPEVAMMCRSIELLVAMSKKRPALAQRIGEIRERYGERIKHYGPVGIAAGYITKLGLEWKGDIAKLLDEKAKPVKWMTMTPPELKHDLREKTRQWRWKREVVERPSLAGIEGGVDLHKTNELWSAGTTQPKVAEAVRIVIAGVAIRKAEGVTCQL